MLKKQALITLNCMVIKSFVNNIKILVCEKTKQRAMNAQRLQKNIRSVLNTCIICIIVVDYNR